MRRDPLATLIKVRRQTRDEAIQKLASVLGEEDRAGRFVHEIERVIAGEMAAASDPDGSDAMVEAFGAWLPQARHQLEGGRRVLADRQAETARVRAELTACRTALESVETLQQQRQAVISRAIEQTLAREIADRPPRSLELDGEPEHEA